MPVGIRLVTLDLVNTNGLHYHDMSHSLHSDYMVTVGGSVGHTVLLCQATAADLANFGPCRPLQVNFDDNNPFSEGFQERERRERLREQQERQRVQLLQEVRNLRNH